MNGHAGPHAPPLSFIAMLGGLLVLLLLGPALHAIAPSWSALAVSVTVGVAMAAGIWSLIPSAAGRVGGCIVGAAFTACLVVGTLTDLPALHYAATAGLFLFCLWASACTLRQVLTDPDVDINRIAGAVCVYILLGLAWAVLYLLLALTLGDDAFKGLSGTGFHELWPQLLYFSFVTLTTLGYGDISPLVPIAGTLAYLEAIIGQLYVAILIAGLVGAHLNARAASNAS